MDSLPLNPILEFNSDTLQYIRTLYGLETSDRREEAIDIFLEWINKQDHLIKKDLRRELVERMIIFSKGSVERAKMKYDKICTFKTLLPNFYEPVNLSSLENVYSFFLPKLTKDHYRVIIFKPQRQRFDGVVFDFYKYIIRLVEYHQAYDYSNGVIAIFDYLETNMLELIKNLNLLETRNCLSLVTEGYGTRLKAIHFLTTSKAIDTIVGIIKQVVSAKIAQRIRVHKNVEKLHEHIERDILPVEYGGKERSIITLSKDQMDTLSLEEFTEYFNMMKMARINEAYSSQNRFSEQYMGVAGSFRKLNVD